MEPSLMNQPQVHRERKFASQVGWVTDVESGALRVASSLPSRGDGRDLHPGDRGVRLPLVLGVRVAPAPGYHLVVVALDAERRRGSDDLDDRYKRTHREQLGQHARHPRAPTAATMALERK